VHELRAQLDRESPPDILDGNMLGEYPTPSRSRASTMATCWPASASVRAAASPATPAPTTSVPYFAFAPGVFTRALWHFVR